MDQHDRWMAGTRRWWRGALAIVNPHSLRNSEPALIALCAPLGAIVGLVVIALHELVTWLHIHDFGLAAGTYLSGGRGIDPVRMIGVPALGGLLLGVMALLINRWRSNQIVDPVEANALYGGRMSLLDSLRLAFFTLISNGAGASVGMEAAYTQLGSGLLSSAGQFLNLRRVDLRVFVAAGSAAAIAAAFNAPLAGAFYAYELVLGTYSTATLAQVAMASLAGTLVARGVAGGAPIFSVATPGLVIDHWEYPLFGLLGVAAGGVGIVTMKMVTWFESGLRRLPTPDWLRTAIGGAGLSLLALSFPQVLGSGHGGIQDLLVETPAPMMLLGLLLAKMVASALSIGAGFRGGLFSSSLFLGCLFGAVLAKMFGLLGWWGGPHQTVFMLVGMGAVAASIVGAPLTMVLLVLEATGDFAVTLCVLSGVMTSAIVTRYAFGYSFSTWRFHQRGVSIRGAHDVGWIAELTVARMMRGSPKTVRLDVPLRQLREMTPLGAVSRVFAIDDDGFYAGMIDVATAHDSDLDDAAAGLVAGDLATDRRHFLLPSQDVRSAMARFATAEAEALPVLASETDRHIVGYLTEAYALRRYAQALEHRRSTELGVPDLFAAGPLPK
ncbi:chloride channel protein [Telmatospirillum siberiense]|uniref:Chloride channel protein n=1 Tax=Telmatospirillum siberiense TaxID=382514 RepID=A0A2N3PT11_9PROT|nr:chloride channel protein [Telmatospirillum siberiense]PKU23534.1 chloride channel protein [Telmatospirillum siberiense]